MFRRTWMYVTVAIGLLLASPLGAMAQEGAAGAPGGSRAGLIGLGIGLGLGIAALGCGIGQGQAGGLGDGIDRPQSQQHQSTIRPDDYRPGLCRVADAVLAGHFVPAARQDVSAAAIISRIETGLLRGPRFFGANGFASAAKRVMVQADCDSSIVSELR